MPAAADCPPDVAVRAGILAMLAQDGPLTRSQLADLLHRRDKHVYAQLVALREAQRVIRIGRRRRSMWALAGTVLPARRAPQPHHASRSTSPTESWWARRFATPEEFYAAARMRAHVMGWDGTAEQGRQPHGSESV